MPKYDFLIVGAGLYGATFANIATRMGKRCVVIDKRNHIGGNCYTEQRQKINIHVYGPHIFHTSNKTVWDYITSFGEFNGFTNQPLIESGQGLYNLPFNMNLFRQVFGRMSPKEMKEIIEKDKGEYKDINPTNLEEQAIKMVGKTLYEMFVKHYTEKQWGKKCKDLPADTIKRLPLRFTHDNNYFDDTYQGIPKKGYTNLIQNMLKGSLVILGKTLEDIPEYIYMTDKVIWTGMIDDFFNYKLGKLEYRSLKFIDKTFITQNYQGNAVINNANKHEPYTRKIEHRHFDKDCKSKKTIISLEIPEKYIKGKNDPYYPIGNKRNIDLYNKYKILAEEYKTVHFAGRLGEYKYYDMDDTIEKAMELAEKLTE